MLVLAQTGRSADLSASLASFGTAVDGRNVQMATLRNSHGMLLRVSTRGGTITQLDLPDRSGTIANVVLGKPDFAAWEEPGPPFNNIVGRYANRIAGGGFYLDGQFYKLAGADPKTGIVSHGGPDALGRRLWAASVRQRSDVAAVSLHYLSADGESGYPGALDVSVTYSVTEANILRIEYRATTTRPTVLNLTNHTYFHLAGATPGPVYGETLQVFASQFTPTDAHQVPTGELRAVAGTAFDFRQPARIAERIYSNDPQMLAARGLDHNFVLDKSVPGSLSVAARLQDAGSGRILEVRTTEPGMQVYTANFFNGASLGADGHPLRQGDGIAFETQHFPNSPNQPGFPNTVLRPGEVFQSTTEFAFTTDAALERAP